MALASCMRNHGRFTYSWLRKRSEIFIFVASHFSTGKHRRHEKKLRSRAWERTWLRGVAPPRARPPGFRGAPEVTSHTRRPPPLSAPANSAPRRPTRARFGKNNARQRMTAAGKGEKAPPKQLTNEQTMEKAKAKAGKLKKKTRCESRSGSGGKPRDSGISRRAFRVSRRSPAVERGVGVGVRVTSDPVALRGFCGSA